MKFKVYATCVIVKGFQRAILIDFDKNDYFFIPLDLADIIEKYEGNTIESVKNDYPQYGKIIDEYFDFLLKNKLIFFTEKPELFNKINWIYKSPSNITNALIEIDSVGAHKLEALLEQLEDENCKTIELFFTKKVSIEELKSILDKTNSTIINSIELTLAYQVSFTEEILDKIYNEYPAIHFINFYSSPFDKQININGYSIKPVFYYKSEVVLSEGGNIQSESFIINQLFFSESLNYNTYHNRKVVIDVNGNIKNCPAMGKNYGNINETHLSAVIEKKEFKEYWHIKKDDIDVCQDCEFRHICSDSRSFVKDPNNVYSQPSKCGYNPYIGLWEGQDKWCSVSQWRKGNPNWKAKAKSNRLDIING